MYSMILFHFLIIGFLYIVSNADTQEIVFYEFFDHSINTTLFGLPFNVEVRHLQYSMIVHVSSLMHHYTICCYVMCTLY